MYWVTFGVFTFLSLVVFIAFWKAQSSWKGKVGNALETNFQYLLVQVNGYFSDQSATSKLLIGIDDSVSLDFSIKRQNWVDRVFKKLGISPDVKVGDYEFDRYFHIVSANSQFQLAVLENKTVIEAVKKLRVLLKDTGCELREIKNSNRRLWANMRPHPNMEDAHVRTGTAIDVVYELKIIRETIQSLMIAQNNNWTDRKAKVGKWVIAFSAFFSFFGVLSLIRTLFTFGYTIETFPMWLHSSILGIAITAFFVAFLFLALGRSTRTHLVLLKSILFFMFGAVTNSFALISEVNMIFDKTGTTVIEVKIERTKIGRGSNILVADWVDGAGWRPVGLDELRNTGSKRKSLLILSKLKPGDKVVIHQRQGFFGYPWVERAFLKPPN